MNDWGQSFYSRCSADTPSVAAPTGSALLILESLDGLRTSRNPMLPLRSVGESVSRFADRQNAARKDQLPPRFTRYEPPAKPMGSVPPSS